MYEDITFETILQRMLDRMNGVDKREGSIAYDVSAPIAIEFMNLCINLDSVLYESFADTASKEYLIKRCNERGLAIEPATYAVRQAEFNIDVPIGSRFSLNELNYVVTEKIEDGIFKAQCETIGTVGNTESGAMIPIEYIDGLETALLTDVLIPGEDEEDVEHLRQRYFDSFDSQAFGGNIADYKEKINSIKGVGGVKVYRTPNGVGGTVKVVIIDSTYSKPSETLVENVQNEIDPIENQGEGLGIAPIGHKVTVFGCNEVPVDIQTSIKFKNDWNWDRIKDKVNAAIDDYFTELAEEWKDTGTDGLEIKISQIVTRLLDIEGVSDIDIQKCFLNENSLILQIDKDSIPIRGDVTNV